MAVIMDETRKFKECPWCKAPGRLFSRSYTHYVGDKPTGTAFKYSVGCPNIMCWVKPRTKAISDVALDKDFAISQVVSIWEAM